MIDNLIVEVVGILLYLVAFYVAYKVKKIDFLVYITIFAAVFENLNVLLFSNTSSGYFYSNKFMIYIFKTPLFVFLDWAILVFGAYLLSLKLKMSRISRVFFVPIFVVIVDFLIEGISVSLGFWTWSNIVEWSSLFSLVAPSNFVGWLGVIFGFMLCYEFFKRKWLSMFLGYFVFEDSLKETAEEAIKLAKKLGVSIKVITGDSKEVAGHVAKRIKLIHDSSEVISGETLDKLPSEEFDQMCEESNVFARISPQLKYKIVKSLQKRHDVGFLGDGVNDAPALRMANVGIAVEGASDISKEVSDIVLLKRDLRVIIQGIEDGRIIFANINKYIKCMLASNFGNFYSIAVISLFIDFLPMLPIQILLSNLISDIPLISIVTDTVDSDELKKPKAYNLRSVLPLIISLAIIITLADFAFFSIFYKQPPSTIQTLWFIESVFCELLLVFIIRTKHLFWKAERPSFSLILSIVSVFAITIALPFLNFGQKVIHFSTPKSIPDFNIQMPSKANANGSKNESTKKLFVKPVEIILAP